MYVDIPTCSSHSASKLTLVRWRCDPEDARFIFHVAKRDKDGFKERIKKYYALEGDKIQLSGWSFRASSIRFGFGVFRVFAQSNSELTFLNEGQGVNNRSVLAKSGMRNDDFSAAGEACYYLSYLHLIGNMDRLFELEDFVVRLFLSSLPVEHIDYKWESRMLFLLTKYLELERLMWNLSTLGGACSAMADYDISFAKRAGQISKKQMQIAAELEDRTLLARCHLYIALSAAQQANFAEAKRITRIIYLWSRQTENELVQACCHGVRAKIKSIELYGTHALRSDLTNIKDIEEG